MPIFEFKCPGCGKVFEKLCLSGRNTKVECPDCGCDTPQKIFSTCGIPGSYACGSDPSSCVSCASKFT